MSDWMQDDFQPGPGDPRQPIADIPTDGRWVLIWERFADAPFVGRVSSDGIVHGCHEHVAVRGGWEGAVIEDEFDQSELYAWMPIYGQKDLENF